MQRRYLLQVFLFCLLIALLPMEVSAQAALSQTYTAPDQSFTVNYPGGMTPTFTTSTPTEVLFFSNNGDVSSLAVEIKLATGAKTLSDVVPILQAAINTKTAPSVMAVGDRQILYVEGGQGASDQVSIANAAILFNNGDVAMIVGRTDPDDFDAWKPTVLAMVDTLKIVDAQAVTANGAVATESSTAESTAAATSISTAETTTVATSEVTAQASATATERSTAEATIETTSTPAVIIQVTPQAATEAMGEATSTPEVTAEAVAATSTPGVIIEVSPDVSAEVTLPVTAEATAVATEPSGPVCIVTASPSNINLRNGPGTSYDRVGELPNGQTTTVDGQAIGDDGAVWYRTSDGDWLRSNLVIAQPVNCANVPTVSP